jgi:hypothetical protein
MKILVVSFAIWLFVVPLAVGFFLIFTFLAARIPAPYFTSASLALTFSVLAMICGLLWPQRFSSTNFRLFSKSQQRTNSVEENKYEKHVEGQARS